MQDVGHWHAKWEISRFAKGVDPRAPKSKPFSVSTFEHNLLLNEGINEMLSALAGDGGTPFSNGNAYLGVGDTATAADPADTGLKASSNKLYKAMEVSYPTYGTSQQIVFRSVFGSADANWLWTEFTVANGNSDSGVNLNRKVSNQGTKIVGQSWTLTLTITIS